jgi:hypothetical protein
MKTIKLIILSMMFSSLASLAQTTDKKVVSFCDHDKTISLADLKACPQLTCNDKNIKIKSYFLGEKTPTLFTPTGVWDSSVISGINVVGASFKNKIGPDQDDTKLYTEYVKAGMTLYVRNVIIIENNKEVKYPDFSIVVK